MTCVTYRLSYVKVGSTPATCIQLKLYLPPFDSLPRWPRVTQLTRNAIARSMRHTVSNILACQCQPMVSGGHTHKAVNKATLTDRCSLCLYILLLYVWHIWQRQPSSSHNALWPDVFIVISKFRTSFLTPKFPNIMLCSLGTLSCT